MNIIEHFDEYRTRKGAFSSRSMSKFEWTCTYMRVNSIVC